MSKYQRYNIMPAGFSEEEDSDSDGFSFPEDNIKPKRTINNLNRYDDDDDDRPNVENNAFVDKKASFAVEFKVIQACISGTQEVIEKYIKDGNNVNEFLHTEWTLLLYAASAIHVDIIQLLLDHGADPNLHREGFTPLMALCNSNNVDTEEKAIECLHILLKAKADPNALNKNRENALMLAIKFRSVIFIKELMDLTEDLNLTDSDGNTVLHNAVINNRIEVVELLMPKVDTTIRNRHNSTAYEYAVVKQFDKIAQLLAPDIEDNFDNCEVMNIEKWQEMFPDICGTHEDKVLQDISLIIYGMRLEQYKPLFKGMSLRKLLNLTEDDLSKLGMNISIHRKRFIDSLLKFHNYKWSGKSLGFNQSKKSCSIFDAILALGNTVKKFCIIGSSFNFIQQNIVDPTTNELLITEKEREEYEAELLKLDETMVCIGNELQDFKRVAKMIELKNRNSYPATYIGKKKKQCVYWPIIFATLTVFGLCLFKSHIPSMLSKPC